MARKPRIHIPGATYHVLLRGQEGRSLFKSVSDRRAWEALVEEGSERFGHQVQAYCWSRDHIQMAVQVQDAPLSRIMQNLSFRYTRHFNKRHEVEGSLFQGRYRAILIDPDAYLKDLVRYVHNNPVRCRLSASAADYRWSSFNAYMGNEEKRWLSKKDVLRLHGKTQRSAINAMRRYTESGQNEGEREDLVRGMEGGRALGDQQFLNKVLKPVRKRASGLTLDDIVRTVCDHEGVREAGLRSESRARRESRIRQMITYLALELDVANLTVLAERFNRDLTTMSRNQRYFRERLDSDRDLQKQLRILNRQVRLGLARSA